MQKLQLEQKIDSKTEDHNLNLENTSQITWRDIQGLTWLLEEDY
ncbi:MAG: hypothetical protein ACE5RI_01175 [Candidatus Nitrosomaritimum yanchengensis]